MKKILLLLLISTLSIQKSTGNTLEYLQQGPDNCLLAEPGTCPVNFLTYLYCEYNSSLEDDQPMCTYIPTHDTYFLNADLFITHHNLGLDSSYFHQLPDEILHDIFEDVICSSFPGICFTIEHIGHTLYQNRSPDDPVIDDGAICQITPEACSGLSK